MKNGSCFLPCDVIFQILQPGMHQPVSHGQHVPGHAAGGQKVGTHIYREGPQIYNDIDWQRSDG